jgi:DNA-binding NtrC family response regulator
MAQILVIDDDYSIRSAVRKVLEKEGHDVIEALNGEEGARMYTRFPVDLVITDILMPEKDGVEVLLELRADHPNIKAIVISGEGQEFLPAAEEFGALRTLSKPFRPSKLIQIVREVLEQEN